MIRRQKWKFIGRAHDGATYLFVSAGTGFARDFHEVAVEDFWRET